MKAAIHTLALFATFGLALGAACIVERRVTIATVGRMVVAVKMDDICSMVDKDIGNRAYVPASVLSSDGFWSQYASPRMAAANLDSKEIQKFTRIFMEPLHHDYQRTVTVRVHLIRGGKPAFEAITEGFSDYCINQRNERRAALIEQLRVMRLQADHTSILADRTAQLDYIKTQEVALATTRLADAFFPKIESAQIAAPPKGWR